jgi:hypothetical protein
VQNLTQALKSIKDPGNTFDLNPKWEISREKMPKNGKVLSYLGFISKVFPGSLAALSSWVGFCIKVDI